METYEKVTRVEVIGENGREYINFHPDNIVQTDIQDDGRTLKIFISIPTIAFREMINFINGTAPVEITTFY